MVEPVISEHIESTPGVCGGRPRIAGHRIRVEDIVVWHEMQGKSPDEIVADFPQLTLADVYAALAYYHDHREEICQAMDEDKAFVAALRAKSPSKLLQKLMGNDAGDSLSS
ncbi:MAG: DUF433 domain-containing protein [Pirellulales bacterium]